MLPVSGQDDTNSLDTTFGSDINTGKDYKGYQNSEYGIAIQYPSTWEKVEHLFEDGAVIEFISLRENKSDLFRENVEISVKDMQNVTSLEEYISDTNRLLNATFVGFNITSSEPTTLASNPAHKRTFFVRQPFVDLSVMQILTIKDGKVYALTFTAHLPKYDDSLPVAQKMIDSFKIMNATSTIPGNMTVGSTSANLTCYAVNKTTGQNYSYQAPTCS